MRFQTICAIGIIIGVLGFSNSSHLGVALADGPSVVINELMWMGSSLSSADEWLELRNLTEQSIDLAGWSLTKRSSGADVPMVQLPIGTVLPAGGFLVVSNYASTSTSSALAVVPDIISTDVALSNTGLRIQLLDASGQVVDAADDGIGNPMLGNFDSSKKIFASMERNVIVGDGSFASSWHTATRSVGWKSGVSELGTPGSMNSNGAPVAHAGPDVSGVAGVPVNVDGSESADPEMQPLAFFWEFGDGATSTESAPSHIYTAAGAYTATLTVNDGADRASDTVSITIRSAPAASPALTNTPSADTLPASDIGTTSCFGLQLSELYPNQPGVDNGEFIELVNSSDEDIVTGSCKVYTSATKSYLIPPNTTVSRGGFLLLAKEQAHITLNNGGMTIRLIDTNGDELDRTVYSTAAEGATWSRFGSTWSWTTQQTPNAKNVVAALPASSKKSSSTNSNVANSAKQEIPPQAISLSEVQGLDSGDRVIVTGVVTVARDALGSTVSYIQNDTAGVSLTIPNGEPVLQVGQRVEVTGTIRLKSGRRYIAVATKGLRVLSIGDPMTAPVIATDDVGIEQADQLVHVRGVIALASGSTIQLDDGSGSVSVYLKSSTGIVRPKVKAGDTMDIIGIVALSTSGVRILPRQQSDLHLEQVLGVTTSAQTPIVVPAASKQQTFWYWALVLFGGLVASAKPLIRKFREKKKTT
jgi:PKD repeat protein